MGKTNKVIVFVFFGEQYLEQFSICAETIPLDWNVHVITDCKVNLNKGYFIHRVATPATVYEMLIFRKRIPEFIDINKYDFVYYSDPDILFNGDIMDRQEYCVDHVLLAYEPDTSMRHPCMRGGFSEQELSQMEEKKHAAINGGFYGVPKSQYKFFDIYRTICDLFTSQYPNEKSIDQWVLNNIFHRDMIE